MHRVAVLGLALTGTAVARAMNARGIMLTLGDNHVSQEHQALAEELGAVLIDMNAADAVDVLLEGVDTLMPAPGVPPSHPAIVAALQRGIAVRSEIDVAYVWEQNRIGGPRPILGVTGTDGKTTTTMMAAHLLRENGFRVAEVGNTDLPFVAAVSSDVDVFVVECSSFRLRFTTQFRCNASVWLNFAPDHLDWHPDLDDYASAKEQMWKFATDADVAVFPVGNERISLAAQRSGARTVSFGLSDADYCVHEGRLLSPQGSLCEVENLWRSMPHDITNSLAAAALVIESGLVSASDLAPALASFTSAHHRIEHIGDFDGSGWFDDSKATSPHAALTAIRAFDSVVLIAGGRNKGLDLNQMATEPHRMAGVVAIGDDAPLIAAAFAGVCEVRMAQDMQSAVLAASSMSSPGVAVLLSPGCTSYDWYSNYNERGEHFTRCVLEHFGKGDTDGK
jgi:UDP-N-acetylmuramoylalanine--D-glutamate ligase